MDDIVEQVVSLYKEKDWKTIIKEYRNHPDRNKLLWVFPTEENFAFLANCLVKLKCNSITSVGCGSGLLEWMITEATGLPVSGIEVDGAWWRCKYAPPTFIPLLLAPPDLDKDTISLLRDNQTALLFCYFNDRDAFNNYLDNYAGNVLIIIGPEGKGVHTDPQPFGDVPKEWTLYAEQEVESSRDFIAVYCKK